jgi:hypothetical protein
LSAGARRRSLTVQPVIVDAAVFAVPNTDHKFAVTFMS